MVQTDIRVIPTTKLLWVAFGLGCFCFAFDWGYDNSCLSYSIVIGTLQRHLVECVCTIVYVVQPMRGCYLLTCSTCLENGYISRSLVSPHLPASG